MLLTAFLTRSTVVRLDMLPRSRRRLRRRGEYEIEDRKDRSEMDVSVLCEWGYGRQYKWRSLKNARNRTNQRRESQTVRNMAVKEINILEVEVHRGKKWEYASDGSWSLPPSSSDNASSPTRLLNPVENPWYSEKINSSGMFGSIVTTKLQIKYYVTTCQQLWKSVVTKIHEFRYTKSCSKFIHILFRDMVKAQLIRHRSCLNHYID
jgi:hypothetical protein